MLLPHAIESRSKQQDCNAAARRTCGAAFLHRCYTHLRAQLCICPESNLLRVAMQDQHACDSQSDLEPSSRLARHHAAPAAASAFEDDVGSESDLSLDQIDLASTAGSGSENRLYLRLALHAGGNILTLLLVLVLWTVWSLLSTFRNPMIWALLCSTALQDIKEDLVVILKRKLADDRCVLLSRIMLHVLLALNCKGLDLVYLPSTYKCCCACRSVVLTCLSVVLLPFAAVTSTLTDMWHILSKWNQYVREYEKTSQQKVLETEADSQHLSPFAAFGTQKKSSLQEAASETHRSPPSPSGEACLSASQLSMHKACNPRTAAASVVQLICIRQLSKRCNTNCAEAVHELEEAASTNQETLAASIQRKPSKRRASLKAVRGKRKRRAPAYMPPAVQVYLSSRFRIKSLRDNKYCPALHKHAATCKEQPWACCSPCSSSLFCLVMQTQQIISLSECDVAACRQWANG